MDALGQHPFFRTVSHVEVTESHRDWDGTVTLMGWSRVKNAKSTVEDLLKISKKTVNEIFLISRTRSADGLLDKNIIYEN